MLLGVLSDRMSPHLLGAASSITACLSVALLWGLAGSRWPALLAFSIIYGFLGGGFSSLWSGAIRESAGNDRQAAATFFGLCAFTRGIGVITSGPISSALVGRRDGKRSGYTSLIVYTSVMLFASGAVQLLNAFLARKRNKRP